MIRSRSHKAWSWAFDFPRRGALRIGDDEVLRLANGSFEQAFDRHIQTADSGGLEATRELPGRVQSLIVILAGSLGKRRLVRGRSRIAARDILHRVTERSERVNVGVVLVYHPGLAPGRHHPVHRLKSLRDVRRAAGGVLRRQQALQQLIGRLRSCPRVRERISLLQVSLSLIPRVPQPEQGSSSDRRSWQTSASRGDLCPERMSSLRAASAAP